MSRSARLTVENKDSWYFLHAKVDPKVRKSTLNTNECGDKLLSIIETYAKTFCCNLGALFISEGHYALVVKFHKFQKLSLSVMQKKASALYQGKQERVDLWNKKDWSDFNDRLFDVGEFMRSIQMTYSRWHNSQIGKKGKLWAERFKSSILTTDEAALDAIMYVESGPIREKDSTNLTGYKYSSLYLRESRKVDWLYNIDGNFGFAKGAKGKDTYLQILKHRCKLPIKSKEIEASQIKDGYPRGVFLKRQRYFLDGLVVGSQKDVIGWINMLRGKGKYKRKAKARKIAVGTQFVLREQRSHYKEYK